MSAHNQYYPMNHFSPFGKFLTVSALLLALPFGAMAQRGGAMLKSDLTLSNENYVAGFSDDGLAVFHETSDSVNLVSPRGTAWGTVEINYRVRNEDWNYLMTGYTQRRTLGDNAVAFVDSLYEMPLWMQRTYTLEKDGLKLDVLIGNNTGHDIELGDAYLPLRSMSAYDKPFVGDPDPSVIFPGQFIPQHNIAKESSFILYSKPSGTAPWYMLATGEDTPLEFFTTDGGYKAYVWSGCTGPDVKGNWRWPHTTKILGPHESVTLHFSLTSTDKYEDLRDLMVRTGLVDIRTAPGYVVPTDQTVRMAVRSLSKINSVSAEYPSETTIKYVGRGAKGYDLYDIKFSRLGENLVTVNYGDNQETVAEFFCSEPVETLLKKRSAFLTKSQQHKAPGEWWDGLYSLYDMKFSKLRGPEDSDGYDGWWGYMLACDDPILGKAPFIAAKNAVYPDSAEIASLNYHIEHYVWGGLQNTDADPKHPYAVWGVPNYYVAKHPDMLAKVDSWTGNRPKIWRTYDYPHVGRLYWNMYKIAQQVPQWTACSADEYFKRAVGTFKAYFDYPREVDDDAVVYAWGIYDEWVIPDIIAELEKKGMQKDADYLRENWEKKAKHFIYDDPYPYRSEYSFDRTAFESTYALAKYAVEHPMASDPDHKNVTVSAARDFMDRQHYAGLAVRGWLEPKFFLNGADVASSDYTHTLTYMAMMAGWSILDYGLLYSKNTDWIELGYNSYMSTWALMNTGTPESNYGYWFPGKQNDGSIGMAFVSAKSGKTWIHKFDERGVWRYDGEIDLGLGASFHTARTILVDDDVFGLHVLGGSMSQDGKNISIVPADGVLQQFSIVLPARRVHMSLDRDGFSENEPIVVNDQKGKVSFSVSNHSGKAHEALLTLRADKASVASVTVDGRRLALRKTSLGWEADVPVGAAGASVEVRYR